MTPSPPEPRRILVIHVTRIGDTVMVSPALRAVAAAYPRAEITVLGHPKRAEVLANLPGIFRVGTITKRTAPFRGWLARERWDLALVFGYDEALVRYALRVCARVVAFRQSDARLSARLFRTVDAPARNTMHGVDQLLLLPRALGIEPKQRALDYRVTTEEAACAAKRLLADGIGPDAMPLIGFVVESFPTKPYRNWRTTNFAALAAQILRAFPRAHFLVFGGALAPTKLEPLREALGARLSVHAGRLSLRQTAALLARLDLYVGVDTGLTHIAGALRVPAVALYHCLHPSRLLAPPDCDSLTAVDHPDVDSPNCSKDSDLGAISVDAVWRACRERLAATLPAQA